MRILVVESQTDLNTAIVRKLESEGCFVDYCFNGIDALEYTLKNEYDGIVISILLPDITGIGVIENIRIKKNNTPILIVAERNDTFDIIAGLDVGASDFIVKPLDVDEVATRIRVMIGRREIVKEKISHKGISLDLENCTVTREGERLKMTMKEYALLRYLMNNIGKVITRERLSSEAWYCGNNISSNIIDVYVHHLRKKLENGEGGRKYERVIETVKGFGYIIR